MMNDSRLLNELETGRIFLKATWWNLRERYETAISYAHLIIVKDAPVFKSRSFFIVSMSLKRKGNNLV
jgi:hypothetical protein